MRFVPLVALTLLSFPAAAMDDPASSLPSDAAVAAILADRIDAQHQGVGIVVGLIDPGGTRIVAHGVRDPGDPRPVDGDTLFEIGSATKVFTALLLAQMAGDGEVALDDPVARYLPPNVHMPQRGGRQITLQDLAMHISGLPRLPANTAPARPDNPYADYSVDRLYAFLGGYALPRDIGATYEYSNLGAGLLGHVLALRAGTSYEKLVHDRIATPLGLASTAISLSPDMQARLAPGHDATLAPAPNWDLPTLAGAGALRSSARDLLGFLAAELALRPNPLADAMARQLAPRRATGMPGVEIALAWHISTINGRQIVWHNGGTGGYRSFIGFDPAARTGVVVLANAATERGGDDIGMHLLARAPLQPAPVTRKAVTLEPAMLERYVGRYRIAPETLVTVTREEDHLFAQLTGQPRAEIHPESETAFFWTIVDAQARFQFAPDGRIAAMVIHQNGRDVRAERLP